MKPIYLDYAATTPVDRRVAQKMLLYLLPDGIFGNPASSHAFGDEAKQAVELARSQVAAVIQAEASELVWTSGATEANNLALKGAAALYQSKGKHIITLKTEHRSVLDCCQELEKQGFSVTYLTPAANGMLAPDKLAAALRDDTILVSVMHVNNETGVIQDLEKLAAITAARGILFHTDAAQSAGKIPLNMQETPVDLVSLCAHKLYGPKGVGALYVRRKPRVRVAAQIHGGAQEQGMRSGTLAPHQIVAMGEAFAIANLDRQPAFEKMLELRAQFLQQLPSALIEINSDLANSYPGILNIRFINCRAETLIKSLPQLAFSKGSACVSKGIEPSYVLRALGLTDEQAHQSVRFSFGRFTTEAEIDIAAKMIADLIIS